MSRMVHLCTVWSDQPGDRMLSLKDGRTLNVFQQVAYTDATSVADLLALVDVDGAPGVSSVDIVRNTRPRDVCTAEPLRHDVLVSQLVETSPDVLQAWADHGVAPDTVYLLVRPN